MICHCPICASPASVFAEGNIEALTYFSGTGDYAIAASKKKDRLPIYKCDSCGHGFTPVNFDPQVIVGWYEKFPKDDVFISQRSARSKTAKVVLNRIEKLVPNKGMILDLGSGPAFFLKAAKDRGWNVQGIEPAYWAIDYSVRELGIEQDKFIRGDYNALKEIADSSLDVVTAFDVIEHVVDPADLLYQIKRVLKPDGLLVMTTPRFSSLLARVSGKTWHAIMPEHIQYFTDASMQKLLKKENMKIVRNNNHVRYLPVDYVASRFLSHIGLNAFNNKLKLSYNLPVNFGDEFELHIRNRES